MKIVCFVLSVFLLISCQRDKYKAPENLISEEQMVDVLYEHMLMNAAKGINKKVLEQHIQDPAQYIFDKFNIDSLQFAQSNTYYANNNEVYASIYERLKQKLESDKKAMELLVEAEKKKNDSIKKSKRKEKDTIFEFNRKEKSLKNRRLPSVLGFKNGTNFEIHSTKKNNIQSSFTTDYATAKGVEKISNSSLKRFYFISDKKLLVVDSLGYFDFKAVKFNWILLRNSPKIHLEKLIETLQPELIIADGSNYRSFVKRWIKTCVNKGIKLHYTFEDGAFIYDLNHGAKEGLNDL